MAVKDMRRNRESVESVAVFKFFWGKVLLNLYDLGLKNCSGPKGLGDERGWRCTAASLSAG